MEREREKAEEASPSEPERDVLLFLLEHAPLERWERDVLEIIREEAYYFAPQRQTKIMNEGWATYWHSQDHDREGAARPPRSSTTPTTTRACWRRRPGSSTRTSSASSCYRDIEERWNKGQFGKEWDECDDLDERAELGPAARARAQEDLRGAQALQRRDLHRRVPHRRTSAASTSSSRSRLNDRSGNYEIESREFKKIKEKLLFQLTNFGQPFIYVEDANYENRGELLLRHRHEGIDLQIDHARETLAALGAHLAPPGEPAHRRRGQAEDVPLRRQGADREGAGQLTGSRTATAWPEGSVDFLHELAEVPLGPVLGRPAASARRSRSPAASPAASSRSLRA